ncbi:hypothetical protein ACFROC_18080 [Nocardia tengchongensis]|uniref:hypothetical protein n=1 Tax=Nocardia tengchongensis TaxID=2055889 RepID=UPI0036ADCC17
MTQICVRATVFGGAPVWVVIPRFGRYTITADQDGTRWLRVRTWWGRTLLTMPVHPDPAAPEFADTPQNPQ